MRKKALLFTLSAGMIALVLSSYSNGPYQGGAGNRTGSAGSTANCSTGGCHAASSSNTVVTIGVTTLSGTFVFKYVPGTTYKVTLQGANTGGSLPKFGFQASCVKVNSPSAQAGSFVSTASNISVRNTGSLQLVEHNTPIAATVSTGGNSFYTATFNWTAPSANTGDVRFYAILNAVNGNNATSGDQPSQGVTFDLSEQAAGISSVSMLQASVYPNPAANALHIKLSGSSAKCNAHIMDMSGRIVAAQELTVTNGEAVAQVSTLKAGNYYLVVAQDGKHYLAPFVKY